MWRECDEKKEMLRLPLNLLVVSTNPLSNHNDTAEQQQLSPLTPLAESKKKLINTIPSSLEEVGGSNGLKRYSLGALKQLCRNLGCSVPSNASRASVCGVLTTLLENKDVLREDNDDDVHEVFLTASR